MQHELNCREILRNFRSFFIFVKLLNGKSLHFFLSLQIIRKILAKKTNREFYDCDKEIEKIIGCEISSFLNGQNEEEFRNIEEEVIKELSKKSGVVISTGGGVIKRSQNIQRLKQNGKII